MKRKIKVFFVFLLIWTLVMSLYKVISGIELKAANLGVIIFAGAIAFFTMFLVAHIANVRRSKIAVFFIYMTGWVSVMALLMFISGQTFSATSIGVIVIPGTVWAVVTVRQTSEESRR